MARDILLSAELDLKRINAQIRKLESRKVDLFSGDAKKLQKFQQPLGKIVGTLGEFEKSLEASNARVIAFGASAGAIYALQKAVSSAFKSFVDVEGALKDINVILGATSGNLAKFGQQLFEISKKTGTSFKEVAEAATELSRQGLGVEETLKRTTNALTLARLSGMDAKSAVEALTAAINSFNKAALTSTQITNKLAHVDAKFAVSSQDLAEAIKRVASSAQSAGVSFDELVAAVTSAQQMTARGGNVIGNSLKTIFTRVQRPRVIRDLEKLGVTVRNTQGILMPTMKILKNMAVEFDNLGKSQKAQAAEMVGGVFQVNILKAVLSDLNKEYSVYNQALKASIGATDEAEKRIQELTKTFAGLLNQTKANATQLGAAMAKMSLEPVAKKVLQSFNKTFEKAQNSEGIGATIGKGMLKGLGTFLSGPGLAIGAVAFVKLFSKLTMFAKDAFQSIMGLNKASQAQVGTQRQIYDIMSKNPDLLKQILRGELSVSKAHDAILDKINAENLALQAQQKIIGTLGGSSAIGRATAVGRRSQGKLGKTIGETASGGFGSGSMKEFLGMIKGGYSQNALRKPGIKQVALNDGKKSQKRWINKHEQQYSFKNSKGKSVDMVIPEKGSRAYKDFVKSLGSSRGFVPNFTPYSRPSRSLSVQESKTAAEAFATASGKQYKIVNGKYKFPRGTEVGGQTFSTWTRSSSGGAVARKKTAKETSIKQERYASWGSGGKFGTGHKAAMLIPREGQQGQKSPITTRKDLGKRGADKDDVIIKFPLATLEQPIVEKGEETAFIKHIKTQTKEYALKIGKSLATSAGKTIGMGDIDSELKNVKGFSGAVNSAAGAAFEVAARAGFGFKKDKKVQNKADFDVTHGAQIGRLDPYFDGLPAGTNLGDLKITASKSNVKSMKDKILKLEYGVSSKSALERYFKMDSSQKTASKGFNAREVREAMVAEAIAGGQPEFRSKPFPHVADKNKQKDFSGVVRDHPNIVRAIEKSKKERGSSRGFVPNFVADPKVKGTAFDDKLGVGLVPAMEDVKIQYRDLKTRLGDNIAKTIGLTTTAAKLEAEETKLVSEIAKAKRVHGKDSAQVKKLETQHSKLSSRLQTRITLEGKQEAHQQKMSTFHQRYEKSSQNLLMASFVLPQVMGVFGETFAKGSPRLQSAIDSVSGSLSTGAAVMGLIPGPFGRLAGLGIAGIGAMSGLIKASTDLGESYKKAAERAKEDSTLFSDSSSKYLSALESRSNAFKRDNEGRRKSVEDINKIYKRLQEAIKGVPIKYRDEISSITNLNDARARVAEILKEVATKEKNAASASAAATKIDDVKGLGKNVDADDFFSGANDAMEYVMKLGGDELRKAYADPKGMRVGEKDSFRDIMRKLEKIEAISAGQREVFERIVNLEDLQTDDGKSVNKIVDKQLKQEASQDIKDALNIQVGKTLDKQREVLLESLNTQKDLVKAAREQVLALNNFSRTFKAKAEGDRRDLILSKAKGALDVGSMFLTERAKSEYNLQLEQAGIDSKAIQEARSFSAANLQKTIGSLIKKIGAKESTTIGARGIATNELQISQDVKGYVDELVKFNSKMNSSDLNANFENFGERLLGLVANFSSLEGVMRDQLTGSILNAQQKEKDAVAELERERRKETHLAILGKEIETQKRYFNELKGAFGGIQSFIEGQEDGSLFSNEGLKKAIDLMLPDYTNTALDKTRGRIDYARGTLGVAQEIMKSFPSTFQDTPEVIERIRAAVLPSMTAAYTQQLEDQKNLLREIGGTEAGDLIRVLEKINPAAVAVAQTDAFLKRSQLPETLQKMVEELHGLNKNLELKNLESAFLNALNNADTLQNMSKNYDKLVEILGQKERKAADFESSGESIRDKAHQFIGGSRSDAEVAKFVAQKLEQSNKNDVIQTNELVRINKNASAAQSDRRIMQQTMEDLYKAGTSGHSLHVHDFTVSRAIEDLRKDIDSQARMNRAGAGKALTTITNVAGLSEGSRSMQNLKSTAALSGGVMSPAVMAAVASGFTLPGATGGGAGSVASLGGGGRRRKLTAAADPEVIRMVAAMFSGGGAGGGALAGNPASIEEAFRSMVGGEPRLFQSASKRTGGVLGSPTRSPSRLKTMHVEGREGYAPNRTQLELRKRYIESRAKKIADIPYEEGPLDHKRYRADIKGLTKLGYGSKWGQLKTGWNIGRGRTGEGVQGDPFSEIEGRTIRPKDVLTIPERIGHRAARMWSGGGARALGGVGMGLGAHMLGADAGASMAIMPGMFGGGGGGFRGIWEQLKSLWSSPNDPLSQLEGHQKIGKGGLKFTNLPGAPRDWKIPDISAEPAIKKSLSKLQAQMVYRILKFFGKNQMPPESFGSEYTLKGIRGQGRYSFEHGRTMPPTWKRPASPISPMKPDPSFMWREGGEMVRGKPGGFLRTLAGSGGTKLAGLPPWISKRINARFSQGGEVGAKPDLKAEEALEVAKEMFKGEEANMKRYGFNDPDMVKRVKEAQNPARQAKKEISKINKTQKRFAKELKKMELRSSDLSYGDELTDRGDVEKWKSEVSASEQKTGYLKNLLDDKGMGITPRLKWLKKQAAKGGLGANVRSLGKTIGKALTSGGQFIHGALTGPQAGVSDWQTRGSKISIQKIIQKIQEKLQKRKWQKIEAKSARRAKEHGLSAPRSKSTFQQGFTGAKGQGFTGEKGLGGFGAGSMGMNPIGGILKAVKNTFDDIKFRIATRKFDQNIPAEDPKVEWEKTHEKSKLGRYADGTRMSANPIGAVLKAIKNTFDDIKFWMGTRKFDPKIQQSDLNISTSKTLKPSKVDIAERIGRIQGLQRDKGLQVDRRRDLPKDPEELEKIEKKLKQSELRKKTIELLSKARRGGSGLLDKTGDWLGARKQQMGDWWGEGKERRAANQREKNIKKAGEKLSRTQAGAKMRRFSKAWIGPERTPYVNVDARRKGLGKYSPKYELGSSDEYARGQTGKRIKMFGAGLLRHPMETLGGAGEGIGQRLRGAREGLGQRWNRVREKMLLQKEAFKKSARFQGALKKGQFPSVRFDARRGTSRGGSWASGDLTAYQPQYDKQSQTPENLQRIKELSGLQFGKDAPIGTKLGALWGRGLGGKKTPGAGLEGTARERLKTAKEGAKKWVEEMKRSMVRWKPEFNFKEFLSKLRNVFRVEQKMTIRPLNMFERGWNKFVDGLNKAFQAGEDRKAYAEQQGKPMTQKEWDQRQAMRRQGSVGAEKWTAPRAPRWHKPALRILKVIADFTKADWRGMTAQYGVGSGGPGASVKPDPRAPKSLWPRRVHPEVRNLTLNQRAGGPRGGAPAGTGLYTPPGFRPYGLTTPRPPRTGWFGPDPVAPGKPIDVQGSNALAVARPGDTRLLELNERVRGPGSPGGGKPMTASKFLTERRAKNAAMLRRLTAGAWQGDRAGAAPPRLGWGAQRAQSAAFSAETSMTPKQTSWVEESLKMWRPTVPSAGGGPMAPQEGGGVGKWNVLDRMLWQGFDMDPKTGLPTGNRGGPLDRIGRMLGMGGETHEAMKVEVVENEAATRQAKLDEAPDERGRLKKIYDKLKDVAEVDVGEKTKGALKFTEGIVGKISESAPVEGTRTGMNVLRRLTGNPLLSGEPGVGASGIPEWMEKMATERGTGKLPFTPEQTGNRLKWARRGFVGGHLAGLIGTAYTGGEIGESIGAKFAGTPLDREGRRTPQTARQQKYAKRGRLAGELGLTAAVFGGATAGGLGAAHAVHGLGSYAERETGIQGLSTVGSWASLPAFTGTTAALSKVPQMLPQGIPGAKGAGALTKAIQATKPGKWLLGAGAASKVGGVGTALKAGGKLSAWLTPIIAGFEAYGGAKQQGSELEMDRARGRELKSAFQALDLKEIGTDISRFGGPGMMSAADKKSRSWDDDLKQVLLDEAFVAAKSGDAALEQQFKTLAERSNWLYEEDLSAGEASQSVQRKLLELEQVYKSMGTKFIASGADMGGWWGQTGTAGGYRGYGLQDLAKPKSMGKKGDYSGITRETGRASAKGWGSVPIGVESAVRFLTKSVGWAGNKLGLLGDEGYGEVSRGLSEMPSIFGAKKIGSTSLENLGHSFWQETLKDFEKANPDMAGKILSTQTDTIRDADFNDVEVESLRLSNNLSQKQLDVFKKFLDLYQDTGKSGRESAGDPALNMWGASYNDRAKRAAIASGFNTEAVGYGDSGFKGDLYKKHAGGGGEIRTVKGELMQAVGAELNLRQEHIDSRRRWSASRDQRLMRGTMESYGATGTIKDKTAYYRKATEGEIETVIKRLSDRAKAGGMGKRDIGDMMDSLKNLRKKGFYVKESIGVSATEYTSPGMPGAPGKYPPTYGARAIHSRAPGAAPAGSFPSLPMGSPQGQDLAKLNATRMRIHQMAAYAYGERQKGVGTPQDINRMSLGIRPGEEQGYRKGGGLYRRDSMGTIRPGDAALFKDWDKQLTGAGGRVIGGSPADMMGNMMTRIVGAGGKQPIQGGQVLSKLEPFIAQQQDKTQEVIRQGSKEWIRKNTRIAGIRSQQMGGGNIPFATLDTKYGREYREQESQKIENERQAKFFGTEAGDPTSEYQIRLAKSGEKAIEDIQNDQDIISGWADKEKKLKAKELKIENDYFDKKKALNEHDVRFKNKEIKDAKKLKGQLEFYTGMTPGASEGPMGIDEYNYRKSIGWDEAQAQNKYSDSADATPGGKEAFEARKIARSPSLREVESFRVANELEALQTRMEIDPNTQRAPLSEMKAAELKNVDLERKKQKVEYDEAHQRMDARSQDIRGSIDGPDVSPLEMKKRIDAETLAKMKAGADLGMGAHQRAGKSGARMEELEKLNKNISYMAFTTGFEHTGRSDINAQTGEIELETKSRKEKIVKMRGGETVQHAGESDIFFYKDPKSGKIFQTTVAGAEAGAGAKFSKGAGVGGSDYLDPKERAAAGLPGFMDVGPDGKRKWQEWRAETSISGHRATGIGPQGQAVLTRDEWNAGQGAFETRYDERGEAIGEGLAGAPSGLGWVGGSAVVRGRGSYELGGERGKKGWYADETKVKPGHVILTPQGPIYNRSDVQAHMEQNPQQAKQLAEDFKLYQPTMGGGQPTFPGGKPKDQPGGMLGAAAAAGGLGALAALPKAMGDALSKVIDDQLGLAFAVFAEDLGKLTPEVSALTKVLENNIAPPLETLTVQIPALAGDVTTLSENLQDFKGLAVLGQAIVATMNKLGIAMGDIKNLKDHLSKAPGKKFVPPPSNGE